jgi:hypothetical protein
MVPPKRKYLYRETVLLDNKNPATRLNCLNGVCLFYEGLNMNAGEQNQSRRLYRSGSPINRVTATGIKVNGCGHVPYPI